MKIAIIAKAIEPIICGGAENVTRNVYEGLKGAGLEVRLFSKYKTKPSLRPELGLEIDNNWSQKVAHEVIKWCPDVIYVSRYWGETTPLYIHDIPMVIMHHSTDIETYPISRTIKKYLLNITKKIIVKRNVINLVPSPLAKNYYKRLGGRKKINIVVNPLGAEFSHSRFLRRKFDKENIQILYIGRIAPKKGLHFLIQALSEWDHAYKLLIAGEYSDLYKSYFDRLKQTVSSSSSNGDVIFLGYVNESMKMRLFSQSSFVVQPSLWGESFGLACLEALRYKGLLVASDIFLETGVINKNNSFIFKRGNKKDFLDALNRLINLDHAAIRKIMSESKRWTYNFSWKRHVENLIQVFSNLV
jgi:glycosyltransferase involved in cell wall biosynthesis